MSTVSYALTTKERFKSFAGLSGTTDDDVIDILINAATDFIENYCDRRFKKSTFTQEIYGGDNGETIILKNFPVDSASALTVEGRDSSVNEDDWETIDSQYLIADNDSGVIAGMGGFRFRTGRGAFRVTYTAGYDFNNTSTYLADVGAADLELACWMLIKSALDRRSGDSNVQSERLREYSVTYFVGSIFDNQSVKSILDKYSRVEVGGSVTPRLY